MKLSFIPGRLFLNQQGKEFVITLKGEEVFRTRIEKKALTRFSHLRKELEVEFPPPELTTEQKRAALQNLVMDKKAIEVRNSTKVPKRDRIAKTRTFG